MEQHEPQKWLPAQFHYTKTFEEDTEPEDRPIAEEAITAQLFSHFAEHAPSVHSEEIVSIVADHFPVVDWSLIPSHLEDLLGEILTRWAQALVDPDQPTEEEATEISKELLIFALAELHPTWVAEVEEEEPLFEVVYTIHMVGSTRITAKTPQQLDGRIETTYETLDVVNCDIDSHDEEVIPLNDAARELLVQSERIKGEKEKPFSTGTGKGGNTTSALQEQDRLTEGEEAALLVELRERLKNDQVKALFGERETCVLLSILDRVESTIKFPRGIWEILNMLVQTKVGKGIWEILDMLVQTNGTVNRENLTSCICCGRKVFTLPGQWKHTEKCLLGRIRLLRDDRYYRRWNEEHLNARAYTLYQEVVMLQLTDVDFVAWARQFLTQGELVDREDLFATWFGQFLTPDGSLEKEKLHAQQQRDWEKINRLASEIATAAARRIFEQEMTKDTPSSFTTAVGAISVEIGNALVQAGSAFSSLDTQEKDHIAAQALREVGYPETEV